jgi:tRNA threonylcarbamoyl adenosine modification protein YeaZ
MELQQIVDVEQPVPQRHVGISRCELAVFHIDRHAVPVAGPPRAITASRPLSSLGTVLLAFDTATPFVTVALYDGEDVVVEERSEQRMKHGEQLAPLIDAALTRAGIVRQDLTALAVGVGPGPFTGLRVGLVTARTLAFVLDLPVYGVCSLDVIAVQAVHGERPITTEFTVATDARRKEVYLAAYDEQGRRFDGPDVLRPADAATDQPVAGEGAVLYPESFPDARAPVLPSAGWLARVVAEELAELRDPEPMYLRRPDAIAPGAPKRVS